MAERLESIPSMPRRAHFKLPCRVKPGRQPYGASTSLEILRNLKISAVLSLIPFVNR
jgi:hypothetical protein